MIVFVRPPLASEYNDIDVREEAIVTFALGYLKAIGFNDWTVFDFNLDHSLTFDDVIATGSKTYVVCIRETGGYIHYARRIALNLAVDPSRQIILYGQIARLSQFDDWTDNIVIVQHDERALARALNLPDTGPTFDNGLQVEPYFQHIKLSAQRITRFKASLETTRGCNFRCKFCFINAGENYPQRFIRRSTESILSDVRRYRDMGVQHVIFHDSEFIDIDHKQYGQIEELLVGLESLKDIHYMIYARADTLTRFGHLDLFKRSGLKSVFIGVESFYPDDLKALGKGVGSEVLEKKILELMENEIFMTLSFILFNRSTTTDSIRYNIEVLRRLYSHKNSLYLGMPSFGFSYEASWKKDSNRKLSEHSYMRWLMWKRDQSHDNVVFDPKLEPLMEIYRVFNYEQSRKIIQLNYARDTASSSERKQIDVWYKNFGLFTLNFMTYYLEQFEQGKLTLDSIPHEIDRVFELYIKYNSVLPLKYRDLLTEADSRIPDNKQSRIVEYIDHGWDKKIPFLNERTTH